jgi:hypothetical protein
MPFLRKAMKFTDQPWDAMMNGIYAMIGNFATLGVNM